MWIGIFCALVAGLMWGLVFVSPLLLAEYPPVLQSVARYLAFGLIALPLGWADREGLRQLTRADWWDAIKLAAVGNLIYYTCLANALQRAGAPLPTVIIGTLPVVIATVANQRKSERKDQHNGRRDALLPWKRLAPSLLLIAAGIGCVNQAELAALLSQSDADLVRYATGAVFAVCALACWTWYPLHNADWLRRHPGRSPRVWATAQGLTTLPLALTGYLLLWGGMKVSDYPFAMPFGPRPEIFLALMFALGLLASWLGTMCWNEASQRLPMALAGQLIVFETLAALSYAYLLRGKWPAPMTMLGIALLVAGVIWAVRVKPEPVASEGHAN